MVEQPSDPLSEQPSANAGEQPSTPPGVAPATDMPSAPASSAPGVPTKFCFACGAILDARAEICPKCGVRQMPVPGTSSIDAALGHSRIVASLLAIFLGSFGIHKFYLGKTGQGIVYLLFFWTLIPGLLGFIEGIWYLTMSDAEFQARWPKKP